jgi:hypothetical protein
MKIYRTMRYLPEGSLAWTRLSLARRQFSAANYYCSQSGGKVTLDVIEVADLLLHTETPVPGCWTRVSEAAYSPPQEQEEETRRRRLFPWGGGVA